MFKFWTVFAVLRVEINERVSIMKRMRQRMLYIVRNICSIDRIFELAKMKFDDKKKKRLMWIVKFYLNIKLNESIDWACSHLELVVHWLKVSKFEIIQNEYELATVFKILFRKYRSR